MRAAAAIAFTCALVLLCGCSLVKLSEDIVQSGCRTDADCEVLDTEAALERDPCQRWACDDEDEVCVYGPLDRDHDGQSPPSVEHDGEDVECETREDRQDCDDRDDTVGAEFMERCDMIDNDCDQRADEGALEVAAEPVIVLPANASATDAAYALDPMTREVAVGYGLLDGANVRPAISLVDGALTRSADVNALDLPGIASPQVTQAALAALASGRFAFGFVNRTTSGRDLRLASVAGGGAALSPAVVPGGDGIETCLAGGCDDVGEVGLARQAAHVLTAYVRHADENASCGTPLAPAAELHLGLALQPSAGAELEIRAADVALDDSTELGAPAVLAVPPLGGGGDDRGFLVGYVDGAGDVVVSHVTREGNALAGNTELLRVVQDGDTRTGVALALQPDQDEDGTALLAVAHQRGCGVEGRIVLGLYAVDADGDALNAALLDDSETIEVGGGTAESSPAVAYSAMRDTWAVVYRDRMGLRARVVDSAGRRHGDAPYTLLRNEGGSGDAGATNVLLAPHALTRGADFGAIAHVAHGSNEPRTFEGVRLGCGL